MFDAIKAVFNCPIQSRYYNDTFVTNPPCTKIGNDTENISIYYQKSSFPYLQAGDIVLKLSSRIVLNAPVIRLSGSTIQNQGFGKDNFFNVYESINQIF